MDEEKFLKAIKSAKEGLWIYNLDSNEKIVKLTALLILLKSYADESERKEILNKIHEILNTESEDETRKLLEVASAVAFREELERLENIVNRILELPMGKDLLPQFFNIILKDYLYDIAEEDMDTARYLALELFTNMFYILRDFMPSSIEVVKIQEAINKLVNNN
ncbi:hypothetical protein BFU36_00475 [Sulfolobus sp. A20]|uniref:hypothetical protein n=1 Tax=Sulfolobaceae TaxID=118883 RepID=UPI0008461091|nr:MULTISPECIES: hypothetical protein [unclassified Sulfolobus]TRM76593.1 hypothetical protein DJ523_00735 [Sulfolobus sp. E5]TRM76992.1 hypothetical protein DJ532_06360 [Sulfolobus sp. A20-N-F8]TRM78361.1 hypothetical protein DJ528_04925 [Sulfolobus sp. B5]TRM84930.1 hypothetical protein DJ522_02765 [Sulfolobus sp. F3]TRM88389.1 hypothetical protein DJ529_05445 [Sulfolobus sp. C3]TRM99698.1 hypothetical protein DJ527_08275 [Sulfolobus sp. F1]TRN02419.1 hypothetical protein DJ530_04505 [Sulf